MVQSFDFQDDPDSDDDPRKEDDDEQGNIDEPKEHGVHSGSAGDIVDGLLTDRDDGDHEEDSPLSSLSSSSQATTPQGRPDAEQRKPDVARGTGRKKCRVKDCSFAGSGGDFNLHMKVVHK
ncbi:hypothetical protein GE21DRAFT_1307961 [Neurospora crassa]|nr:hypothetical protein GE21DRAFT_1307961 [Neurospora crassa]